MNDLDGVRLPELPIERLEWYGDIVEFEGPVLSEFRNPVGESYLYYWCDCSTYSNRWMVFGVSENERVRLLVGETSLNEIVCAACSDFVFFTDIAKDGSGSDHWIVKGSSVPDDYYPEADSFVMISEDSKLLEAGNVTVLFDDRWNLESLRFFIRFYKHLHNFYYGLSNSIVATIPNMPWRGGFSAMHFYNKLSEKIPRSERPQEGFLQAASPGIIKLAADPHVAAQVLSALAHYNSSKKTIDLAYRSLQKGIADKKLNKGSVENAITEFDADQELLDLREELASALKLDDHLPSISLHRSNFESAKIIMAHYKRIRDVHKEVVSERMTLARWRIAKSDVIN